VAAFAHIPALAANGCYRPAPAPLLVTQPVAPGVCQPGAVFVPAQGQCRQCNPGDKMVRVRFGALAGGPSVMCLQACQPGTAWNAQLGECCPVLGPPVIFNPPAGTLTIRPLPIAPGN